MTQKTILCVDDEPIVLSSLERLFRKDNYTIYTASNGNEALELLKENTVDLIISDYRMPEMNGLELLKTVKNLYPSTIRVILSGYADFNNAVASINEGQIYRFCHKPWDNEELRVTVKQCLEYHDLLKQNRILLRRLQKQNIELQADNNYLEKKNKTNNFSMKIYQNILQKLPIPILAVDITGKILLANTAAINLFPPLSEKVYKTPIEAILDKDTAEYILSLLRVDDAIDISGTSFKLDDNSYTIQVEKFDLNNTIKGGILVLTPN